MKERILELRAQGCSYKDIQKQLGCSLGTIAYHCGQNQKEKHKERANRNRLSHAVATKVCTFRDKTCGTARSKQKDNYSLRKKMYGFQRRDGCKLKKRSDPRFTARDVIEKFGTNAACYLTGDKIDLTEPWTYNFDHIIPATRGGDNDLNNLGLATKEANQAKGALTVQEFLELCQKVLKHHGYEVKERGNYESVQSC